MNRYENNVKILQQLAKYIDKYPQERFIQILWNMGIITRKGYHGEYPMIEDRFYEESNITLQKINKMLDTKNI